MKTYTRPRLSDLVSRGVLISGGDELRSAEEIQADRDFLRAAMAEIDEAVGSGEMTEDQQRAWNEGREALEALKAEDEERAALFARREELRALAELQSDPDHDRLDGAPNRDRRQGEGRGREAARDADMMNEVERAWNGADPSAVEALRDTVLRRFEDDEANGPRTHELVRGIGISAGTPGSEDVAANLAALHIATFDTEAYRAYFQAYVAGKGNPRISDPEIVRAGEVADRLRAYMNVGTATQGGAQVPTHLNPTLRLMDQDYDDGINQWVTHETLVGGANTYNGVSSAGVTVEYPGEGTQVSDGSPTIVSLSIPVHLFDIFVGASIAYDADVGMGGQLGRLFDDAMQRNMAAVLITGDGSDKPTGLLTALDAVSTSEVATDSAGAWDKDDIRDLRYSELPAGFRGRSQWVAPDSVISSIQQFGNTDESFTVDFAADGIRTLLGRRVVSAEAMPAAATSGLTTGDAIAIIGDLSQYKVIHRMDASVEYIQNIMGANQRPTGQRGWVLWGRHGGGLGSTETGTDGVANAFRLLQAQ